MAEASAGSGKYSLEKVISEILELKATQKRYAKQYLDAKSSSTHLFQITPKPLQTVQISKSSVSSLRRWKKQSIEWKPPWRRLLD